MAFKAILELLKFGGEDVKGVFIGHSDCQLPMEKVKNAIREMIGNGVDVFLNGGMGGFDALCARAVFELKSEFPYIKSLLVIPYLSFKCSFADLFDGSIYPEGLEKFYFKAAIIKRNEYMVDNSEAALCYVYTLGRSAKTYKRALSKGLETYYLCQPPNTDYFL